MVLDKKNVEKLRKEQNQGSRFPYNFLLNANGNIKTTSVTNVKIIIENDPLLRDVFRYNEFTQNIDVVKDVPDLHIEKGKTSDDYSLEILAYIESQAKYAHTSFKNKLVQDALILAARNNSYNPIITYFDKAYEKWDHKQRIPNFLHDFLGVEQSAFVEWVSYLFFVGAVAKAYDPSTKFDQVLDLVGGQGAGKTTTFKKLAPLGYYTDDFNTFTKKDDLSKTRDALIINDDELTATNKTSFEELKKFCSKQEFRYRLPYGRGVEVFPRRFVMVRTTNERYYLKDQTGNRRFMPVLCDIDKQKFSPVSDLTPELVEQIWGEAVDQYKNNKFSLKIDKAHLALIELNCEKFKYSDSFEDAIDEVIENELEDRQFITNDELFMKVAPDVNFSKNKKMAQKLQYVMVAKYGYEKRQKRINGERKWGYEKCH